VLVHPWDSATLDEALEVVRRLGFGQLVAPGDGRDLPVVVPTQYVVADGEPLRVLLHLARPNPVFSALAERPRCLLSVAGDWAYVPSEWKAVGPEDPLLGIPTTYYSAVQLEADVEVCDDVGRVAAILRAQLADVQPGIPVGDPEAAHRRDLSGIRGLVLTVTAVRGKQKYGGNVDAAHRRHVAERLAQRRGPGDLVSREHLLRRLDEGR
jgi:transcriptional regulator